MGELKPVGSEKLQGDAKVKRILELTYYQSSSDSRKSTEIVKESKTGVYGIVKEKDGYYVKKGLTESSLDYIGGLFMKNKNKFPSYGEAFKKLEFLVEQENVQEATKYILKQNKPKPQQEAPVPAPTNEPPVPGGEGLTPDTAGGTPPATGDELPTSDELGGDEETPAPEGEEGHLKIIQKLSSKLQQKLTAYEDKLESKDIKAAIMQVLSGVDPDKLEDADKEEIMDKLDPEEDTSSETSDETLPSDETGGEATPAAPKGGEVGESNEPDGMKKLEELIGTSFFDDEPGEGPFDPDEDNGDDLSGIEDDEAMRAAKRDYEKEYAAPNDDDEDEDELEDEPEGLTSKTEPEKEEETDERIKELDVNELADAVSMGVKETLSKYFEE